MIDTKPGTIVRSPSLNNLKTVLLASLPFLLDPAAGRTEITKPQSERAENSERRHLSATSTVGDILRHPAFSGYARRVLPWDDRRYDASMELSGIGELLPYHSAVDAGTVLGGLNRMIDDVAAGRQVFYDIYPETDKRDDPSKKNTGLFFFRGRPGAPFAIVSPGGGFAYVGSVHEGFPYAVEINQKGYNVFVLKYRVGQGSRVATQDLATAISYVFRNSETLDVATKGYSVWGSSAGARMAALIGSHGVSAFGHTGANDQTLRRVRANLSEPEPKLRERLTRIYEQSESTFVRENVAVFVNMTPETFSGVYANAVKETHWLSYTNYAALVSGDSFSTDELATGVTDIFIALDLKVLEAHPGLARVVIGSFLNAIYNRNGEVAGRTLFLLDEVARLGYLRILETARDAGRKYGISLALIFQSIGQMREAYGGRDATSKWFESASWISFAAINDPETAEYISKRCGDTTVEVDQTNRSSGMKGSSRSRSKQLTRRPLILPHEVLRLRGDEQIVFTAGNAPLRCGRAIWFRRKDMSASVGENRFHR